MNIKFNPAGVLAMLLALLLGGSVISLLAWSPTARAGVAGSKHNLTPTGKFTFKATETTGLCVFCHTPHNASPVGPLWNRALSAVTNYTPYDSSTLKADPKPKQPTGSSRLCLSCHDGTLAMGTLLRPPGGVQPTLGKLTGAGVLGTDLSNDHPISFFYNKQLADARGELVDPLADPGTMHLDASGQMQCTSCHDAHVDRPMFMRYDPIGGALCATCHQPTGWAGTRHATSDADWIGTPGTDTNPWPSGGYTTVKDNACMGCHRPHAAGHGEGLLAQTGEAANCTVCHSGKVANPNFNLAIEFAKPSSHPIDIDPWTHKPKEDASLMARHVACVDCHNPHAADNSIAAVPNVTGPLKGVRGIDQDNNLVAPAQYQQEVCYKCHGEGLSQATTLGFTRLDNVRNVRLEFNPSNASYHPVAAAGKNWTIPDESFVAGQGLTYLSRIGCGSCHNNDGVTAGSNNPAGPHGSNYAPLLERNYNTESVVAESAIEFAMCYKCHDQNDLLNTILPNKFPHAKHLSSAVNPSYPTSCATCHDAHGSRNQTRLINFITLDIAGNPVVTQSGSNPISFDPVGKSCTLACHGVDHTSTKKY